jgi:hypothetical protein
MCPTKNWYAFASTAFLPRVITRVSLTTDIKVHTVGSIFEMLCESKTSYGVELGGGGVI